MLLCLAALGCGSRPPAFSRTSTTPFEIVREHQLSLAAVYRPTPGAVHLSLWVDAGSRDAPVPQIATAAAWIAAVRGGGRIRARVTPDGTEFILSCSAERLRPCLDRLAQTLSVRSVTANDAHQARSRLARARAYAERADAGREADRLALRALLGKAAKGLFPLGKAVNDRTVTLKALRRFYRRHYGPNRALLVAAGDVDLDRLREPAGDALGKAPTATGIRKDRALKPVRDSVAVQIDDENHLALAVAFADLNTASAFARALAREQDLGDRSQGWLRSIRAFALRGGAFLLLRLRAAEPAAALRMAAFDLLRLQQEQPDLGSGATARKGLQEISRAAGESWCVGADASNPGESEMIMAAGALIPSDPRRRARRKDRTGATLQRARGRLKQALVEAARVARPRLNGQVDEQRASVRTANGVPIEVRRRPGGTMAVAVRFRGGAGNDPPALHGRTALLAEAIATACRGISSDTLEARLREMGAAIHPLVDPASSGMVLVAPARSWASALDLALGCALYPSMDNVDLTRARLKLGQKLGPAGSRAWSLGLAARLISPSAPGLVAPRGTAETAANVPVAELLAFADRSIGTAGLSVAAVGDLPVRETALRIARRVGFLPRGDPPADPAPCRAGRLLQGGRYPGSGIRVIVAWRIDFPGGSPGARAFASLVSAELDRGPGIEAVDRDGGGHQNLTWAWVSLRVSNQALDSFENSAKQAVQTLSIARLERLVDLVVEREKIDRSAARTRPEIEADRLAVAAIAPGTAKPASAVRAHAAARALLRARPLFFIVRPR